MSNRIQAAEALLRLKAGNSQYVQSNSYTGDISSAIRSNTAKNGQFPYAIVIACSDSRVIPEIIFSAGMGELFTIRVAGNVIDRHQLGSIEYAVSHLKSPLVVVLGHTHCGAVAATIAGEGDSHIQSITDKIHKAIGDETDDFTAASLNVKYAVAEILDAFRHDGLEEEQVVGAVYDIETGEVYWN